MKDSITVSIPSHPKYLSVIRAITDRIGQIDEMDEKVIGDIRLAVDEACSNIIEHAYGGENLGDIHCICFINDVGLTVVLNDHGKEFDPAGIPPPDMEAPLEDRANHGLGLYLIRKIMDEVKFKFAQPTGNTLTLVKYLKKK